MPLSQLQSGGHLLLPLCPPVLEPSLDLYLGQVQVLGKLETLRNRQVFICLKKQKTLFVLSGVRDIMLVLSQMDFLNS